MAAKTNSFEGIAADTAVTPANSGGASGDAFDAVGGSVVTYSTGAMSGDISATATLSASTESYVAWNVSGTLLFGRTHVKKASLPTTHNQRLMWGYQAGGVKWEVRLTVPGSEIDLLVNGSQRIVLLVGTGINANTLYRVEVKLDSDSGVVELRLYNGSTLVASDTWAGTVPSTDQIRYGLRNGVNASGVNNFDDVGYDSVDWVGSASGAAPYMMLAVGAAWVPARFD